MSSTASPPKDSKRGVIQGWSPQVARRHVAWLQSVDPRGLDGQGFAVTLTVRDTPPDAVTWHRLRIAWLKRQSRAGAVRSHWVVEWQGRGTPHLHGALYFEDDGVPAGRRAAKMISDWCEVAQEFGAMPVAQRVERLSDASRWAKYCAKHSGRSAVHYQRQGSGPSGWISTGRLWGHGGSWPTHEAVQVDLDQEAFYQWRRLVRSWRIADARQEKNPQIRRQRIVAARTMLRRSEVRSRCWGVREWLPQETAERLLDWLVSQGYRVTDLGEDLESSPGTV